MTVNVTRTLGGVPVVVTTVTTGTPPRPRGGFKLSVCNRHSWAYQPDGSAGPPVSHESESQSAAVDSEIRGPSLAAEVAAN